MPLYLISYDINEKDAFEYEGLWTLLREMGATKILYSEWIIEDGIGKAGEIYRKIAPKTQKKDRLLVQEIAKDAAWDKLLTKDESFKGFLSVARG